MQVSLLLLLYFVNVVTVAVVLIGAFLSDRSTSNSDALSWWVIALASLLWFIAIPLSAVEVLRKSLHRRCVLHESGNPSKTLS